jgi:transposase InsO family protein
MTEAEVEIIIQAAVEKYPDVKARVITDNGPQFIARDFKEFIRIAGLTQVKTSPYYPRSNGNIQRWHQILKADCLRPGCPLSMADAHRLVQHFVTHYNTVRLHSAIGYITPADRLAARHSEIFAAGTKSSMQPAKTVNSNVSN